MISHNFFSKNKIKIQVQKIGQKHKTLEMMLCDGLYLFILLLHITKNYKVNHILHISQVFNSLVS
jgi:hypothetical protein